MGALNLVQIIGYLGRDPETRYFPDGGAVTNVSVATTETWKDKNGDKQESTEWHRVACFGKLAEIAGEYLKKGAQVYFSGKLTTRKWTDKDGVEKYTTEIRADRMVMLGSRGGGGNGGGSDHADERGGGARGTGSEKGATSKPAARTGGKFDDFEDDIPF